VSSDGARSTYAPVGRGKFFWMSLLTLSIYDVYWLYRNWQRLRDRTGEKLSPFWRAFLSPIWAFSLFAEIPQSHINKNQPTRK
jgi:hypothetical protein